MDLILRSIERRRNGPQAGGAALVIQYVARF